MTGGGHLATAFGLDWRSDIALPFFDAVLPDTGLRNHPAVEVRRAAALAPRKALRTVNCGAVCADGIRFAWRDEAVFDMFEGERIDYLPGAGWTGAMPVAFSSTLAALTLAWRGAIPMHATSVEIDGRALMIAGRQGAGKSTTAAALLRCGARLISDDLTILDLSAGDVPSVRRGRPGIRLHINTARALGLFEGMPSTDARSKVNAVPDARCTQELVPLGGVLVTGSQWRSCDPVTGAAQMALQLFRPRWLAALPGHRSRVGRLMALAGCVPTGEMPAIEHFSNSALDARAARVLDWFEMRQGATLHR